MNELALFAGAGGGVLGGHLLGWRTVCAVEVEPYPASVLCQRQNDGVLPPFPVWDDVCTFDGRPWRGIVDVVSGGFPCQDISIAGKGAGIEAARSGLWKEMFRIVCEVRPRFMFAENSPMLTSRGLDRVLADLASAGYDAAWLVLGADDVGAPHVRKRIWMLAHDSDTNRLQRAEQGERHQGTQIIAGGSSLALDAREGVANAHLPGCEEQEQSQPTAAPHPSAERCLWWGVEPNVGRVDDGVAARVDRIKALGNGQVPMVAAMAFRILYNRLINN